MNAGKYGQLRMARKGIFFTNDTITDGDDVSAYAETGNIIVDLNDGEMFLVDGSSLAQLITYT